MLMGEFLVRVGLGVVGQEKSRFGCLFFFSPKLDNFCFCIYLVCCNATTCLLSYLVQLGRKTWEQIPSYHTSTLTATSDKNDNIMKMVMMIMKIAVGYDEKGHSQNAWVNMLKAQINPKSRCYPSKSWPDKNSVRPTKYFARFCCHLQSSFCRNLCLGWHQGNVCIVFNFVSIFAIKVLKVMAFHVMSIVSALASFIFYSTFVKSESRPPKQT